jgi:hypothetical protein
MSTEKEPIFLFLGIYDDPEIARDDLDQAGLRAGKRAERQLEVDASDLETQLNAAAAELDTH